MFLSGLPPTDFIANEASANFLDTKLKALTFPYSTVDLIVESFWNQGSEETPKLIFQIVDTTIVVPEKLEHLISIKT